MFIVFDRDNTKPYGPFATKQDAKEWLASQEIPITKCESLSILSIKKPSTGLK